MIAGNCGYNCTSKQCGVCSQGLGLYHLYHCLAGTAPCPGWDSQAPIVQCTSLVLRVREFSGTNTGSSKQVNLGAKNWFQKSLIYLYWNVLNLWNTWKSAQTYLHYGLAQPTVTPCPGHSASTKLQNPYVFCFSLTSCSSFRKEPFPGTGFLLVIP